MHSDQPSSGEKVSAEYYGDWIIGVCEDAVLKEGMLIDDPGKQMLRRCLERSTSILSRKPAIFKNDRAELYFKASLIGQQLVLATRLQKEHSVGAEQVRTGLLAYAALKPTPICPRVSDIPGEQEPTTPST